MFKKITITLFTLLIFFLPAVSCSGSIDSSSTQPPSACPFVDEYIQNQMKEAGIPGVSVAVVKNGQIIYLKGFGVASLNDSRPVTPQTVFDLASSSKSFTVMGTLLLEDKGLINIDQPFQKYVPEFVLADGTAKNHNQGTTQPDEQAPGGFFRASCVS